MRNIGELLNKLQKVKPLSDGSHMCRCPAHNDRTPSLHISQADDRILIKCQAGCQTEAVMKALGLELSDLFIKEETPIIKPEAKGEITATYSYTDEQGDELFQVVRFDPKSFSQRHKNRAGEWVANLEGVRRVLYHLPEILQETGTIYFVEGEKDADTLWNWGLVATTSPGGASNWKPEYAEYLKGKKVVVIPDQDVAGWDYAKSVIRSLQNKASSIKCILLPDGAKDISDWEANGGDLRTLPSLEQDVSVLFAIGNPTYQIEEEVISWHKEVGGQLISFSAEALRQERTGIHARVIVSCDHQALGWTLCNVERAEERTRLANSAHSQLKGDIKEKYSKEDLRRDLDAFCAGLWDYHLSSFQPEMLKGDPTQPPLKFLLYPFILEGGGTILFSAPGRGKSTTALLFAICINTGVNIFWPVAKTPVLFINLERSRQSVQRRVTATNKILGLPSSQPLLILNARGKSLSDVLPACRKAIKDYNIGLIILDSISRAGYGDLTENRPINAIIDALSGLCPTWLALGHTPRATEEHIYGGVHFDAGADIIIQLSSQISSDGPLGVGLTAFKANDTALATQQVWAYEFGENGLEAVRKAKPYEFSEIESKRKTNMMDAIIDFILNQDRADASASEIEDALGFNRATVSRILNHSGRFVFTRKEGKMHFFGVKDFTQ